MSASVRIEKLTKKYGNFTAVDGVSFSVETGEIFGLLGPNGAGKTTTVEMIEGLRKPDSGSIEVNGIDALKERDKVSEIIGVQLQSTTLYDNIKVKEAVDLFGGYYKHSIPTDKVLESVSLSDLHNNFVSTLSGGQRQRVALALALVNDPSVIFLDEPTTGLDPQARRNLWEIVENLKEQGKTIILTTHYMEEAEKLCSRIGIIDHGKIIALDTPRNLIANADLESTVEVTFAGENGEEIFGSIEGVTKILHEENRFIIYTKNSTSVIRELTHIAEKQNIQLDGIASRQATLEDVFILLTGRTLRD